MTRRATADDVDAIVSLGMRFFGESAYGQHLVPDAARIGEFTRQLIARDDAAVFVYENGVGVIGMIAAVLYQHPFSDTKVATELAWWVNPENRGRAGLSLMSEFEAWSKDNGAEVMQVVSPEGTEVGRIYTHRGHVPIETTYQRRIR